MRSWIALPIAALMFVISAPSALAQTEVERLKAELAELKGALAKQRTDFEKDISDLKERLDTRLAAEVKKKLEELLEEVTVLRRGERRPAVHPRAVREQPAPVHLLQHRQQGLLCALEKICLTSLYTDHLNAVVA